MKNIIVLFGLVLLFGCGQESKVPKDVKYLVTKEEPNKGFNKTKLVIELNKKVDKKVLTEIAKELRATKKDYATVYMMYYVEGMDKSGASWATTHYTPNLEVDILGSTEKQDVKAAKVAVTGNVLNKWENKMVMMESTMYLVEEDGKLIMKSILKSDGSMMVEEVKKSKNNGSVKYDYENTHGEYYLVEKNGDLGMYDNDGLFNTCVKIE